MPDIDIDFADRNVVLNKLKHRVAKLDTGKKHNTGVYFTEGAGVVSSPAEAQ